MEVGNLIEGALLGLGGASGIWAFFHRLPMRSLKKAVLREMLLDERWDFRSIELLKRAISEDEKSTEEFLIEIGARRNELEKNSWTLKK
jgi:hypothetical protein